MSQRVLITGGASGLGLAFATVWLERGARVLITDINAERGEAARAELGSERLRFLSMDVSKEADFETARDWLLEHWQGVDVVINNAGIAAAGRIDHQPMVDWDAVLDINLKGVVHGCKVFTPLFKAQRSGCFINTASMAGLLNPPMMGAYNVAKAGVIALSETLRYELAPYGVSVTAACPAFFQTRLGESLRSPEPGMDEVIAKLLGSSKLNAEQVAERVCRDADRGRLLSLTHPEGRLAWRLKRFAPWILGRQMRAMAARFYGRLGEP